MLHKVVKPFPCSWDGFTLVDLDIGDERDFGNMAAGLVDEGWIEPAVSAEPSSVEPVPPALLAPEQSQRRKRNSR